MNQVDGILKRSGKYQRTAKIIERQGKLSGKKELMRRELKRIQGLLHLIIKQMDGLRPAKYLDSYSVSVKEVLKNNNSMILALMAGKPREVEWYTMEVVRAKREALIRLRSVFDRHGAPAKEMTNIGAEIKILDKIKSGKNWRSLPQNEIKKALGGAYNSGGGKTGFYRRLTYDEPCPTLVTSPVQKATMLCHPTRTRPLSTMEYARIQEFPEYWNFYGSVADVYRQIGNAVPVKLGKAIGEMLHSVARRNFKIETKRVRGTSVHKELICQ